MNLRVKNYGDYKTNNYGSAIAVQIGQLTFYFSYQTIIAFECNGELYISENIWSNTTARHLNSINRDKSKRMPNDDFMAKLKTILKAYNIEV